eukprot:TRINITY_DN3552_c0_g1_i1.p1 TRINITY_DN3552_c0_g1~~TRINITY_DN3552_c0_g1_i1.p1  ORF type:complete len:151 (+),score=36.74 TRINITY_DN3552_c0_g1_i1:31-453(+)
MSSNPAQAPPAKLSLNKLFQEHKQKQTNFKNVNDRLRKEVVGQVGQVTNLLMDSVNLEVAQIFIHQRKLEQEARKLEQQAERLNKLSTQWLSLLENFNVALKELGDVENWSATMENEMKQIASSLEYVHRNRVPAPQPPQ